MSDTVGRFPCDAGCNAEGMALEDCSAHGRSPRELWAIIAEVQAQRDEALAEVERLRAEVERLRPRRIETVAELDALPVMSVVLGAIGGGIPWQKSHGHWWPASATGGARAASDIKLPALLIWTPEAQ